MTELTHDAIPFDATRPIRAHRAISSRWILPTVTVVLAALVAVPLAGLIVDAASSLLDVVQDGVRSVVDGLRQMMAWPQRWLGA